MSYTRLMSQGWDVSSESGYVFNPQALPLATRAAIAKTMAGDGPCHLAIIGDSTCVGYNGVAYKSGNAWPTQMGLQLAQSYRTISRLGAIPAVGMNDRWALTGNTAVGGVVPSLITFGNAAGTATVTVYGTDLYVQYGNNNAATLTFTVDADGGHNCVPTGAQSWNYAHVAGLADGAHTVVISGPGGVTGSYIGGVLGTSAGSNIYVHNLAIAGSTAATGNDQQNWSVHDFFYALSDTRNGLLTAAGITPSMVCVLLGSNDLSNGSSVTKIMTGIQDIQSKYPGSDIVLADAWEVRPLGVTTATYNTLIAALKAQTSVWNCSLLDWNSLIGGYDNALAKGLLGPDATHPTDANSALFANIVAKALGA